MACSIPNSSQYISIWPILIPDFPDPDHEVTEAWHKIAPKGKYRDEMEELANLISCIAFPPASKREFYSRFFGTILPTCQTLEELRKQDICKYWSELYFDERTEILFKQAQRLRGLLSHVQAHPDQLGHFDGTVIEVLLHSPGTPAFKITVAQAVKQHLLAPPPPRGWRVDLAIVCDLFSHVTFTFDELKSVAKSIPLRDLLCKRDLFDLLNGKTLHGETDLFTWETYQRLLREVIVELSQNLASKSHFEKTFMQLALLAHGHETFKNLVIAASAQLFDGERLFKYYCDLLQMVNRILPEQFFDLDEERLMALIPPDQQKIAKRKQYGFHHSTVIKPPYRPCG